MATRKQLIGMIKITSLLFFSIGAKKVRSQKF